MPTFKPLIEHYEKCLEKHGATPQGVGWPSELDMQKRFKLITDMWMHEPVDSACAVLDLGCGYGAFRNYLQSHPGCPPVQYWGIDASAKMIHAAKSNYPEGNFEQRDILVDPLPERCVDYVVINGVLTAKNSIPQATMVELAQSLIKSAFMACRKGIAFNVMNEHADWKREDLFHWPFDEAAAFIRANCSRHYAFRADVGLYDYFVYVYKDPSL